MTYHLHPSETLRRVFASRPFQGAEPEKAKFVFVGLDANYSAEIERSPIFPELLDYLSDGVEFWRRVGVHHPFLLAAYGNGDGARYHRSFATIGFRPEHASAVSFVELLHLPTYGRSSLEVANLDPTHLKRLDAVIRGGPARFVFIPDSVARLMRKSGAFPWLPRRARDDGKAMTIWHKAAATTTFCHYHLSTYGHQEQKKRDQIAEIRMLIDAA
jgi:hypothetical protein